MDSTPDTTQSIYDKLLKSYKNGTYEDTLATITKDDILYIKTNNEQTYSQYTSYPDPTIPKFYKLLYNKKEFQPTQSSKLTQTPHAQTPMDYETEVTTRCNTSIFKLASHQLFIKRFLSPTTPYNSLLLFHSVGVGKTCTAISIAEQYIGLYNKKVLVILSSNLKDNFKKQIFDMTRYNLDTNQANLCTGTKYPDMIIDRKLIPKDIFEKRINKLINERYQFMGYKELVVLLKHIRDKIEKTERDPKKHERRYIEKVKELFSDRLIIIDEAHNLRMPSETGKKQISAAFLELLQTVTNVKLLLMTATPMFNDPREITWIVNLLLTNDKRPNISTAELFDKTGNFTKKGEATLQNIVRGYVSFMRGENPFSFPFRLLPSELKDPLLITNFPTNDLKGKELSKAAQLKTIQLIGSPMSASQTETFKEMLRRTTRKDLDNITDDTLDPIIDPEENEVTNDMQNMIQLANICYPVNTPDAPFKLHYGKAGFFNCFDKDRQAKNVKFSYSSQLNQQQFLTYDTIQQYAPKLKTILDYVINAQGIVFIYSQYYYSGIIPLAIALEHIGFNKLGGNIASNITVTQKAPLIEGKRPNYIILSRDKELSPNNDKEIALAKSKENLEGELIKVVIVSKIGTEGIDFKRIREMHLLDPWYNINRAEQIIGRGVRTCSHVELPKEKRNTSIYLHALTQTNPKTQTDETIDLYIYRIAERKQNNIIKVENALKTAAIDCEYNKPDISFPKEKLNIKFDIITSQNKIIKNYSIGDPPTETIKCAYTINPPSSKHTDTSTYTKQLIQDEIDFYKKLIGSIFFSATKNTYNDIVFLLKDKYHTIDEDILKYTLDEMVEEQYEFEGYKRQKGYLTYAADKYIFKQSSITHADIGHKARLELQYLSKLVKPIPTTNPKPSPASHPKSNPTTNLTTSIISIINDRVKEIETHVSKKYRPQIIEAVIDRLTSQELIQLMTEYNTKQQNPLQETTQQHLLTPQPNFHKQKDNIIYLFYNHTDSQYYIWQSTQNTFKPVSPLDMAKYAQDIKDIQTKLYDSFEDNITGYIMHKDNSAKFKVRDGKTAGYVCHQTHSLQKDELIRRIEAIDKDAYNPKQSMTKEKLCNVYEAIMRKQNHLKRPFLYKAKQSKTTSKAK